MFAKWLSLQLRSVCGYLMLGLSPLLLISSYSLMICVCGFLCCEMIVCHDQVFGACIDVSGWHMCILVVSDSVGYNCPYTSSLLELVRSSSLVEPFIL